MSRSTVHRWAKDGLLRPVKLGRGAIRYRREDVERLTARPEDGAA